MDPVSSFSGLISGIDFRALADAVAAAERRPITVLRSKIAGLNAESAAFGQFKTLAQAVEKASEGLRKGESLQLRTVSVKAQAPIPLVASADATSTTGSHVVKVLGLATNERLGSSTFSSNTTALGLSGEFLINGKRVLVASTDGLVDVVNTINGLNTGSDPSKVSASILTLGTSSQRLVLTAQDSGAAGINLSDSVGGLLRSLGLLDSTVLTKNVTSDGAKSDAFVNSTLTVSSLLGLTSPPASAAVTLGTFTATIDLATMSLDAIASEINTKAGIALSSVKAAVVQETVNGITLNRLDISGTTSFTDANRILEVLGVLTGGRSSAAQTLQAGNTLAGADLVTAATAATRMDALSLGGVAAGVTNGDTLNISGTRGDGSAFSFTYTVAVGDTIQTLLDRLNSTVDGLKVGTRTATASIDASGRLTVTDGTPGASQLSLSIVANNQGGGTLDFGAITVSQAGLDRQMVKGADATLEVDGVFLTRQSNNVTDALTGVTLELQAADAANPATITITQEVGAAVAQIQALIDAYNALTSFVSVQLTPPPKGQPKPPLSGSSALRSMRTQLRDGLQAKIAAGVAGNLQRLFDIGIEIDRTGSFTLDSAKLTTQIQTDSSAVVTLLGLSGTGSTSDIDYVSASDKVVSGIYNLQVTQAATKGSVAGTGFGAAYVDDATADTITVRDLSTNSSYSASLANGDTLQTIVNNLNAQFSTALPEIQKAATTLYSDAILTKATEATLLNSVFNSGGTNTGIANGDTITISGTSVSAVPILLDFVVTDITTQSLGDLTAAVQGQLGSGTRVFIDANGLLTAEDQATGLSLLTLSISSNNAGGGTFSLGAITSTQKGRGTAKITASTSAGQLKLDHANYGLAEGFAITYAAGGTSGTASLGVAAATYAGLDVAATLGGLAATGLGQLLTGDATTAVEGLRIKYTGTVTGAVGSFNFSRGIASTLEEIGEAIIGTGVGSVDDIVTSRADQVQRITARVADMEARVEKRRLQLIQRFVAAERSLARQSQQTQFLLSQLGVR